jgi:hypothetical protein
MRPQDDGRGGLDSLRMRTWRRVVIAGVILATAFLLYRWWQATSARGERHARRAVDDDETQEPASPGGRLAAGSHEDRAAGQGAPTGSPKLDRAKADEMRERIRALLAEAGPLLAAGEPSAAPSAAASFRTMPQIPQLDGGMKVDPQYLRDVMHSDFFPLAKDCYVTALKKQPQLGGRIVMHFEILGDRKIGGVVDEAKFLEGTTIDDPEFQTCVRESMMSVSFAAPPEDGSLTVTFPILFSPDEPEGGAGD